MSVRHSSSNPPKLPPTTEDARLDWLRLLRVLAQPMVALVGARNASSLGTRMARALANELAEAGYVVVSGLARGIDTCAHHAASKLGSIASTPLKISRSQKACWKTVHCCPSNPWAWPLSRGIFPCAIASFRGFAARAL